MNGAYVAAILNTVGLLCAIGGCVLLYNFGLSVDVNPTGVIGLAIEQENQAEISKGKLYVKFGRLGLVAIIMGSMLQISAGWVAGGGSTGRFQPVPDKAGFSIDTTTGRMCLGAEKPLGQNLDEQEIPACADVK